MPSANLDLVLSLFQADGPDPGSSTGLAGLVEGWGAFQCVREGFRAGVAVSDPWRQGEEARPLLG
jgi:hypothetical protein